MIRFALLALALLLLVGLPASCQTPHHLSPPINSAVTVPRATPAIVRYNDTLYTLYFVGEAWSFLGLCLLVRQRVGPALRSLAERRFRFGLPRAVIVYGGVALLLTVWRMPVGLFAYHVDREYGFATQGVGLWLLDACRGYAISLINALGVWVGYLLLQRRPRTWWLWLWAASIPFSLAQTVLRPVLLDPLYNQFHPLTREPLRSEIEDLARRAGIPDAKILVVNSSIRSTHLNAYVTGLGPTRRIVLYDTLLNGIPDDEVLAIVGHETGHYVLHHVWWEFLWSVVGGFALLWLLSRLLPWAVGRFGQPKGVRNLHDLAGLPIALLLLAMLMFLQTPMECAISRHFEHEADRYGLQLTHLNVAMARVFVRFVTRDYADPDPPALFVLWFYTHPPVRERVEFALSYHPWDAGRRESAAGYRLQHVQPVPFLQRNVQTRQPGDVLPVVEDADVWPERAPLVVQVHPQQRPRLHQAFQPAGERGRIHRNRGDAAHAVA